jgi:tRNA nucleotidyltransferase (CCA-adding enzyme)
MLTISPPEEVISICIRLRELGHQAWLVGGAVRDSIMGRAPHDWDIATDAIPAEVAGAFPHTVLTGVKHGTVTIVLASGNYEVTTFRLDGAYSDGRHPDAVTFAASIDEDLGRRDFTCNAIAHDPINGEWRDPYQGISDIGIHLLRAVGAPRSRFMEDGLRILRAARFSAVLDFDIEKETLFAMSSEGEKLDGNVAAERKHDEILKIMGAARPSRAFDVLLERSLMHAVLLPELRDLYRCEQNRYHAYDVWKHTMLTIDACPASDPILRVAAMLHDVGKPAVRGVNPEHGGFTFYGHEDVGAEKADVILQRLKFSTADRESITHLVRHHIIGVGCDSSKPALRRFVRKVGQEHLPRLLDLARADVAAKGPVSSRDRGRIDSLAQCLADLEVDEPAIRSTANLAINGSDVMEYLGIGPGPRVGACLRRLLEIVTDNPTSNTRETLLRRAREAI